MAVLKVWTAAVLLLQLLTLAGTTSFGDRILHDDAQVTAEDGTTDGTLGKGHSDPSQLTQSPKVDDLNDESAREATEDLNVYSKSEIVKDAIVERKADQSVQSGRKISTGSTSFSRTQISTDDTRSSSSGSSFSSSATGNVKGPQLPTSRSSQSGSSPRHLFSKYNRRQQKEWPTIGTPEEGRTRDLPPMYRRNKNTTIKAWSNSSKEYQSTDTENDHTVDFHRIESMSHSEIPPTVDNTSSILPVIVRLTNSKQPINARTIADHISRVEHTAYQIKDTKINKIESFPIAQTNTDDDTDKVVKEDDGLSVKGNGEVITESQHLNGVSESVTQNNKQRPMFKVVVGESSNCADPVMAGCSKNIARKREENRGDTLEDLQARDAGLSNNMYQGSWPEQEASIINKNIHGQQTSQPHNGDYSIIADKQEDSYSSVNKSKSSEGNNIKNNIIGVKSFVLSRPAFVTPSLVVRDPDVLEVANRVTDHASTGEIPDEPYEMEFDTSKFETTMESLASHKIESWILNTTNASGLVGDELESRKYTFYKPFTLPSAPSSGSQETKNSRDARTTLYSNLKQKNSIEDDTKQGMTENEVVLRDKNAQQDQSNLTKFLQNRKVYRLPYQNGLKDERTHQHIFESAQDIIEKSSLEEERTNAQDTGKISPPLQPLFGGQPIGSQTSGTTPRDTQGDLNPVRLQIGDFSAADNQRIPLNRQYLLDRGSPNYSGPNLHSALRKLIPDEGHNVYRLKEPLGSHGDASTDDKKVRKEDVFGSFNEFLGEHGITEETAGKQGPVKQGATGTPGDHYGNTDEVMRIIEQNRNMEFLRNNFPYQEVKFTKQRDDGRQQESQKNTTHQQRQHNPRQHYNPPTQTLHQPKQRLHQHNHTNNNFEGQKRPTELGMNSFGSSQYQRFLNEGPLQRLHPGQRSPPQVQPSQRSPPYVQPSQRSPPHVQPTQRSPPHVQPTRRSPPYVQPTQRSPPYVQPSQRSILKTRTNQAQSLNIRLIQGSPPNIRPDQRPPNIWLNQISPVTKQSNQNQPLTIQSNQRPSLTLQSNQGPLLNILTNQGRLSNIRTNQGTPLNIKANSSPPREIRQNQVPLQIIHVNQGPHPKRQETGLHQQIYKDDIPQSNTTFLGHSLPSYADLRQESLHKKHEKVQRQAQDDMRLHRPLPPPLPGFGQEILHGRELPQQDFNSTWPTESSPQSSSPPPHLSSSHPKEPDIFYDLALPGSLHTISNEFLILDSSPEEGQVPSATSSLLDSLGTPASPSLLQPGHAPGGSPANSNEDELTTPEGLGTSIVLGVPETIFHSESQDSRREFERVIEKFSPSVAPYNFNESIAYEQRNLSNLPSSDREVNGLPLLRGDAHQISSNSATRSSPNIPVSLHEPPLHSTSQHVLLPVSFFPQSHTSNHSSLPTPPSFSTHLISETNQRLVQSNQGLSSDKTFVPIKDKDGQSPAQTKTFSSEVTVFSQGNSLHRNPDNDFNIPTKFHIQEGREAHIYDHTWTPQGSQQDNAPDGIHDIRETNGNYEQRVSQFSPENPSFLQINIPQRFTESHDNGRPLNLQNDVTLGNNFPEASTGQGRLTQRPGPPQNLFVSPPDDQLRPPPSGFVNNENENSWRVKQHHNGNGEDNFLQAQIRENENSIQPSSSGGSWTGHQDPTGNVTPQNFQQFNLFPHKRPIELSDLGLPGGGPPPHLSGPELNEVRSPSHLSGPELNEVRSPSHLSGPELNELRSPSHLTGPELNDLRSPSHLSGPELNEVRSPSHLSGPELYEVRSPSHLSGPELNEVRSPSHLSGPELNEVRSPSHLSGPELNEVRSPSHLSGPELNELRSPSHLTGPELNDLRSPSHLSGPELNEVRSPSHISGPELKELRSPSNFSGPEQNELRSHSHLSVPELNEVRSPSHFSVPGLNELRSSSHLSVPELNEVRSPRHLSGPGLNQVMPPLRSPARPFPPQPRPPRSQSFGILIPAHLPPQSHPQILSRERLQSFSFPRVVSSNSFPPRPGQILNQRPEPLSPPRGNLHSKPHSSSPNTNTHPPQTATLPSPSGTSIQPSINSFPPLEHHKTTPPSFLRSASIQPTFNSFPPPEHQTTTHPSFPRGTSTHPAINSFPSPEHAFEPHDSSAIGVRFPSGNEIEKDFQPMHEVSQPLPEPLDALESQVPESYAKMLKNMHYGVNGEPLDIWIPIEGISVPSTARVEGFTDSSSSTDGNVGKAEGVHERQNTQDHSQSLVSSHTPAQHIPKGPRLFN